MHYAGTDYGELIKFIPFNEPDKTYFIIMTKESNGPVLYVECSWAENWMYAFHVENNSVYELIRHNIIECIFEWETKEELILALDDTFKNSFKNVFVEDGGCHCCSDYSAKNKFLN